MVSEFLTDNPIEQYPLKIRGMDTFIYLSYAQLEMYRNLATKISNTENSGFFSTCSLNEITRYESMIGITPKTGETEKFRRVRLTNRFNLNRRFTMRLFCEKFNEIVGFGNWGALLDQNRTLLIISTDELEVLWSNELMETIDLMKPVTLNVLITPIYIETIDVSNEVLQAEMEYTFRVGVSHIGVDTLGELVTERAEVEADMITNNELTKTANFIKDQIETVQINGNVSITHFTAKVVSDNELTLEYVVPESVGLIETIELLDANNEVISEHEVEIQTNRNILMVHKIKLEERIEEVEDNE